MYLLRTNADDRLSAGPLGRIEGGYSIAETGFGTDVCTQTSVPYALDDLIQLGTIGLDDEADCRAGSGPRFDWTDG